VTTGLILLFIIASAGAFLLTRARRRLGLPITGKVWVTAIVGFAVVILVIYVAQASSG
jgi:hypothetical protein